MVLSERHVAILKRNKRDIETHLEKVRDAVNDIKIRFDWTIYKTEEFYRAYDVYRAMSKTKEAAIQDEHTRNLRKDADNERKEFERNLMAIKHHTDRLISLITKGR